MKKLIAGIMTALILLTINPIHSVAATEVTPTSVPATDAAIVAKIKLLETRLNEINSMDKSTLTASEKKSLRKEVRGIKREIKDSGGVYLSVGALLLVIILLIVLL